MRNMLPRLARNCCTTRVSASFAFNLCLCSENLLQWPHGDSEWSPPFILYIELTKSPEKLLANGDKWEPELAAAIRADAPYR